MKNILVPGAKSITKLKDTGKVSIEWDNPSTPTTEYTRAELVEQFLRPAAQAANAALAADEEKREKRREEKRAEAAEKKSKAMQRIEQARAKLNRKRGFDRNE